MCPQTKYDKASITKCCAFGEEMVYPPLDTDGNGRQKLQESFIYFSAN